MEIRTSWRTPETNIFENIFPNARAPTSIERVEVFLHLRPYGCPPAFQFGVKLEFTSHATGPIIDPIAAVIC